MLLWGAAVTLPLFIDARREIPIQTDTIVTSSEQNLTLDVVAVVDTSFGDWLSSLENRGDYVGADFRYDPLEGQVFRERQFDRVRVQYYEYKVPLPSSTEPFLPTIIGQEINAVNRVFQQNKELEDALGCPLQLALKAVVPCDLSKYLVKDEHNNYTATAMFTYLKKTFGSQYRHEIVMAWVGSGLIETKKSEKYSKTSHAAGCISELSERFIAVTQDVFLDIAPPGALTAHEVSHALSAEHCERSKDGTKYVMGVGLLNTGTALDPENLNRIVRYVETHIIER